MNQEINQNACKHNSFNS